MAVGTVAAFVHCTELLLPLAKKAGAVHVILQAEDDGTPPLFAYRRVIVQVEP